MPTYRSKWPTYAKQWDKMAIKPERLADIRRAAAKIVASKSKYEWIEQATGVPWYMVGALHWRESGGNFKTQLAQGDRLDRVSTHIPRGRGPFKDWADGAYDALVTLKKLDKVKDWRLEKILYHSEAYNGWGYHARGKSSPYIWGGSNQQQRGKYIADGKWSSTAMDGQPGVASLISQMMHLDPSIAPVRED